MVSKGIVAHRQMSRASGTQTIGALHRRSLLFSAGPESYSPSGRKCLGFIAQHADMNQLKDQMSSTFVGIFEELNLVEVLEVQSFGLIAWKGDY